MTEKADAVANPCINAREVDHTLVHANAANDFDGKVSVLGVQSERCTAKRARNAVGVSNWENTDNRIVKSGKATALTDRFACGTCLNVHNVCRKMHNRLQMQAFWIVCGRCVERQAKSHTVEDVVGTCQSGGAVANVVKGNHHTALLELFFELAITSGLQIGFFF